MDVLGAAAAIKRRWLRKSRAGIVAAPRAAKQLCAFKFL
jgi:hypothetical protein